MLEKLKSRLDQITFAVPIVAGALLVPSILARIDSQMTEVSIVTLVEYLLLLAAALVFLLPGLPKNRLLPVAHTLFYGALTLAHAYNAIVGNFSSFATAGLYGAVAVLFFIPGGKKGYELTALVAVAFFLASALGGGAVNLSILLLALLLALVRYAQADAA